MHSPVVGRHRVVVLAVHDAGIVEQDVQMSMPLSAFAIMRSQSPARTRDRRPAAATRGRWSPHDRVGVCRRRHRIDRDNRCTFGGPRKSDDSRSLLPAPV
jgi:hypothetical protein